MGNEVGGGVFQGREIGIQMKAERMAQEENKNMFGVRILVDGC